MEGINWTTILEIFGVVGGVATIFGLFLAPMFWLGSKIDAVAQSLNSKIDSVSESLNHKIDSVSQSLNHKIDEFKDEVNKEMKDFHGRLCAIEEKRKH